MRFFPFTLDTDVLVSASMSSKGAAALIISRLGDKELIAYTSRQQVREYNKVVARLEIPKLPEFPKKFQQIKLIKYDFDRSAYWAFDSNDAHIVALATASGSKFLVTYNLKDYRVEELKRDHGLICFSPGQFLQYLRSQGLFLVLMDK